MQAIKPKRIENPLDFWKDVAIFCWRVLPASLLIFVLVLVVPQLAWRNDPQGMVWLARVQICIAPVLYFILIFAISARAEKKLRFPIALLGIALVREWTRKNLEQLVFLISFVLILLESLVNLSVLSVSGSTGNAS